MRTTQRDFNRWLVVCLFAIAMAWVESAVVFYLRTMVNRLEPYQANPLPLVEGIVGVELVREAATLLMLITVGVLAGRNRTSRLGYMLVAFGVWDICYYIFLKPMTGWPHSLLDWDVLFLIPLPWWGPILAPMLIALLMIGWGTLVTQFERLHSVAFSSGWVLGMNGLGILLALYVFMADAIRAAPEGEVALREMLPTTFHWPLFFVALVLMSAPVLQLLWCLCRSGNPGVSGRTSPHTESAL